MSATFARALETGLELKVEVRVNTASRRCPLLQRSISIVRPEKSSCEGLSNEAPVSEESTWKSRGHVAGKAKQWA